MLIRRIVIFGAGIAAILAVAAIIAVFQANAFLKSPLDVPANGLDFEIPPGTSLHSVSEELANLGAIRHPLVFRTYARWTGQASAIQAGDYHIAAATTPLQLLEQFTSGVVKLYSFTIIEGWNRWELIEALHGHEQLDATLTDEDWAALLEEFGATTTHPEGLFLPETYHFPRGTSDRDLLRQAYDLMREALAQEWEKRDESIPLSTPYEALILASIVEKETARVDERAKIAGVFVRRLEQRMRLQTDPTVIYGIGRDFNGNLTRKDLQTATPYNTYTRHGLPPTPIAMPGRAAIHAALHPANGEELFFVATGLGDGSHAFSATKEEHDAAVREYLRRIRQQRR